MIDVVWYFAVIVACGIVFLPLHVILSRKKRGVELVKSLGTSIVLSALVGGAFGVWLIGGCFSSPAVATVASIGAALTFSGFAVVYALILPISIDRSLSAHVVGLVYSSPGGRLKEEELFRLYTHAALLGKRLRECEQSGILERRGDELVATPKGRRIAFTYFALERLMKTGAMIERPAASDGPPSSTS